MDPTNETQETKSTDCNNCEVCTCVVQEDGTPFAPQKLDIDTHDVKKLAERESVAVYPPARKTPSKIDVCVDNVVKNAGRPCFALGGRALERGEGDQHHVVLRAAVGEVAIARIPYDVLATPISAWLEEEDGVFQVLAEGHVVSGEPDADGDRLDLDGIDFSPLLHEGGNINDDFLEGPNGVLGIPLDVFRTPKGFSLRAKLIDHPRNRYLFPHIDWDKLSPAKED